MVNMESVKIVEQKPPNITGIKVLHMEKDGTNYDLLALKFEGSFCFGMLGCATDGWLVIEGLNRRTYLFNYRPSDPCYVAEKLSGGHDLSQTDIDNIMMLLKEAIPQESFSEKEHDATEDLPKHIEKETTEQKEANP
jgi:hypothetical protein